MGKNDEVKKNPKSTFNVVRDEICVCIECRTVIPKQIGIPCIQIECPNCGSKMSLKETSI